MSKKNLPPGTIIYADSNNSRRYDCFGVIVDSVFWHKAAKKENKCVKKMNQFFDEKCCHLYRILGTISMREYWICNDPDAFEPDEHSVWHYDYQGDIYVEAVNLRPIVEECQKNSGRIGIRLFSNSEYMQSAINDAAVVYSYLDGKKFNPQKDFLHREDKLLRLFEQAIPLEK